ncbi:MAG TPA: guanitoxin biosynthesis heme-dependent pre-guanitoxin N-hydroxylase GntA [Gemmatimonadaceae bacterium]|nr:guanitoxin biosynthesis heme-dependent pre-guanitoxin N-hydroxylase GntA [Gemmatimonadaceae bacterium]
MDAAFRAFVSDRCFPCLGAASVGRRRAYRLHIYGALGSAKSAGPLARDLGAFVRETPAGGGVSRAFIAVFPQRRPASELLFERRLWAQLQLLHERDDPAAAWDPAVSADPGDPRFAFSFAGRAFFVVGLHDRSSRLSRRFQWPTLVFNPHAQFERLRAEGRYARYQALIRERDLALQGTVNPSLADFGEGSAAGQYSGRATEAGWRCPFHRRAP